MVNLLKQFAQIVLIAVCMVFVFNGIVPLFMTHEMERKMQQKVIDEANRDRLANHQPLLANAV